MSAFEALTQLATVDLLAGVRDPTGFFGRPFYFAYSRVRLLPRHLPHAPTGVVGHFRDFPRPLQRCVGYGSAQARVQPAFFA